MFHYVVGDMRGPGFLSNNPPSPLFMFIKILESNHI